MEKCDFTERIKNIVLKPEFELYLLLLKFILYEINKSNLLFQTESAQIHLRNGETNRLYCKIFEYVVKDEYINIEKFKIIDINNSEYLKYIYLGLFSSNFT